jgi:hypothetical protein
MDLAKSEGPSQQDFTLLNEREPARRLGVSAHALRFWRARGKGPPWVRIGERLIRHDLAELRRLSRPFPQPIRGFLESCG